MIPKENKLSDTLKSYLQIGSSDIPLNISIHPGGERYDNLNEKLTKKTRSILKKDGSAREIGKYSNKIIKDMLKPIVKVLDKLDVNYSVSIIGKCIIVDQITKKDIADHLLQHPDVGRLEYKG